MEVRTLELNIISAEGLKKVSTFGHDTCYAVAYIYSSEMKSTGVDRDGGENPSWNAKLTLDCEDKLLRNGRSYITVDIYSYGSFSNKLVGTATIPLVDAGKQEVGKPEHLAYEVRRPSGKVRGVLNLSLKVGEKRTVNQKDRAGQAVSTSSSADVKKRQHNVSVTSGYTQTYPPTSWNSQGGTAVPQPPPKSSHDYTVAHNAVSVYPPPKPTSEPLGDSSATRTSGSKKDEEPVLAYPASGFPGAYPPQQYGQQYGPQYYGSEYTPGPQGYYYPGAQPPYGYQQQYTYSKPSKYHGSSSSSSGGLGLLGGVLGGLLLGDVIGNIF